MRLRLKTLVTTLLLTLAMMPFQNCSQSSVNFLSQNKGKPLNDFFTVDGGGTYDGKPDLGTYLRQSVRGCNSYPNEKITGRLIVDDQLANITNDQCAEINYGIEFSDSRLKFSKINREIIGFRSAIYERSDLFEEGRVINFWCRNQSEDFGLDLVVRTRDGRSEGSLYMGQNLTSSQPILSRTAPFEVHQRQSLNALHVSSSDGLLNTEVALEQTSSGEYLAQTQLRIGDRNLDVNMSCLKANDLPAVYSDTENLLAAFQLNGSERNSVLNSRDARLSNANGRGAIYTPGRFAQALEFDGEDDYLDVSFLASQIQSSMSVSLWLQPNLAIRDDRTAFTIVTSQGDNILKIGTGLCEGTQDRARLSVEIGEACSDSGINILDSSWHMVTLTMDSGEITLYLNGQFVLRRPINQQFSPSDIWSIGRDLDGSSSNDYWHGSIDEVVFWNSQLSANDIQKIFLD